MIFDLIILNDILVVFLSSLAEEAFAFSFDSVSIFVISFSSHVVSTAGNTASAFVLFHEGPYRYYHWPEAANYTLQSAGVDPKVSRTSSDGSCSYQNLGKCLKTFMNYLNFEQQKFIYCLKMYLLLFKKAF